MYRNSRVSAQFSVSLDGFIAGDDDGVGPLFDWYEAGNVETWMPGHPVPFHFSEADAAYWNSLPREGAFISGRRLFDLTKGWGGHPPNESPTVVLTHRDPPEGWPPERRDGGRVPFEFAGDLESALERAADLGAGEEIGVAGANVVQQCLKRGVVDELRVDLVPVLLGSGIRWFGELDTGITLDDPSIIPGTRVTHLVYQVRPPAQT
ncbi:dihydrofolate reductase [Paenarthrobacter nitroguajacolicus]|uniref:dihydrofolate reductase family protein n=1 Tax=Paenarthrobacter nitroguajacolicus TaxID=211146 RepID=UPI0028602C51|nr:dihydrofolate reductase family protein [Paenarthrobacter nitroguajacolicus]MDR6986243.1 dihydrofolate reductase [Paenarthrobacter nitroguajacolicus]